MWWVGVAALAGLLVGILRRVLKMPQKTPGIIEDLKSEEVDPVRVPSVVAVSAVSLIGGASLGPEVALGQIGGGSAGWIARLRRLGEDDAKSLSLSGMAGAFGGLFSSPLVAMALVIEVARPARQRFERTFFGSLVATSISFGLYFAIIGSVFLGIYTIPAYDFEDWHLLAGIVLGLLSALVVLITVAIIIVTRKAFARLPVDDLVKPVIGGVVFGLIAVILPLTLFTGSDQLETVVTNADTLGLALLVAILLGKMVAYAVSSASGFIGGPIFPILFLGGTAGVIVKSGVPGRAGRIGLHVHARCRAGSSRFGSVLTGTAGGAVDPGRSPSDRADPDRRGYRVPGHRGRPLRHERTLSADGGPCV